MIKIKIFFLFSIILINVACARIPEGLKAVDDFEIDRYLGKWYEIARLDHSFERGLTDVTAEYLPRERGGIKVINRGFDYRKNEWREARGRAHFVGAEDIGRLKVSFFGPFYGGYNIIALDKEDYSYSLVAGPNRNYLWILARERELDSETLNKLLDKAKTFGFQTEELIFVTHENR